MYTYRRLRTHTACDMRTPPTVRVHLSTLIHDSDAHRRFLRYAYAIFRPSGCVGTPRGWRRSDTNCRFRIFCSNRGQRVNPRLSMTVAYDICTAQQKNKPFWTVLCIFSSRGFMVLAVFFTAKCLICRFVV